MRSALLLLSGLLLPAQALAAQEQAAQPEQEQVIDVPGGEIGEFSVAIPPMPTPSPVDTPAGNTATLGRQVAGIVAADLRNSRQFRPSGPDGLRAITYPEVSAPAYDYWRGTGAENLVQGYVQANADGTLTVGCYLYDVTGQTQLTRQGFVVPVAQWR